MKQASNVLAEIGGIEINTQLMRLLADEKQNTGVRRSAADALEKLGERTVAPDLMRLLADEKDPLVCSGIATALETIPLDETEINVLVSSILQNSGNANIMHRILWKVSRQAKVTIFIVGQHTNKQIEVVKW